GTTQNYKIAADWFCKAAKQGHTEAQLELGLMYKSGHGVPQNAQQAAIWLEQVFEKYRRDAERGRPYGQQQLGFCYMHGIGVTKNRVLAAKWLILSNRRSSHISTSELLQTAKQSMSSNEIF